MATRNDLSSSWTRTSQPARAITSSLSTRPSLSIPPASEGYEPFVKGVLRYRLGNYIVPYSLLFSWVLLSLERIWSEAGGFQGALLIPLSPLTFLWSMSHWITGALPIVIMRKTYLTAIPTPSVSPSQTLRHSLALPRTFRAFLIYATSAILLTFLYRLESQDPTIGIFVKSKKHPYYLNARFLFLLWSQMVLATAFWFRNVMLDRFVVQWSPTSESLYASLHPLYRLSLSRSIAAVFLLPCLTVPITITLSAFARAILFPFLFKIPLVHYLLRPFIAHFVRVKGLYMIGFTAWKLSVATCAGWEWAEDLFEAYVKQPVAINPPKPIPLVSGIICRREATMPETYYQYFAYFELAGLASSPSDRALKAREALFTDQTYQPSMWNVLIREALFRLGTDYRRYVTKKKGQPPSTGEKPPPQEPVQTPTKQSPQDSPDPSPPSPLIRKDIFKKTPPTPLRSVIDAFAADGAVTLAAESGVQNVHLTELLQSVGSTQNGAKQEAKAKMGFEKWIGLERWWRWDVLEKWAEQHQAVAQLLDAKEKWDVWWKGERMGRLMESHLPNRELDVLIVEVLSHLICASLTEDKFGVVQRDIPRTLEAFLCFLEVVENDLRELRALPTESLSDRDQLEHLRTREVLLVIEVALRNGLIRIVRTFGDKLLAFKFPVRVANQLEGFLSYI